MFSHAPPPADQPSKKSLPHISPRLWVIGLLLTGFAIRLYKLGGESLWYDETVSVYLATQSLTDLIAHTARDIHPPAYYMLLHFWRLISQPSIDYGLEFLYSWPSLYLDILVMALSYTIAKRCFGLKAAQWALALAIFHPSQLWFAQEVRMYALGAFSLMLTLWTTTSLFLERSQLASARSAPRGALKFYPIAALLGLYSLYYFVFWLVVLNLGVIFRLWKNWRELQLWLALQLFVVIGWLPWLPIFTRQALSPPVPAWREPWQSATEFFTSFGEAIAAIWTSDTSPFSLIWPWAILVLCVGAAFYASAIAMSRRSRFTWLLLTFGAPLLLIGVSLIGPPIYHVRYVSTYAPLFVLLFAVFLANSRQWLAAPTFTLFALIGVVSIMQLWTSPLHAADDHRLAVSTLARQWRPGDAILVNAGWAYTTLSVYWPTELSAPDATRPPPLTDVMRLTPNVARDIMNSPATTSAPLLYATGSIGGNENLGWGLPESDFFAISADDTRAALTQLATHHTHFWHYRIYDTVSDPNGVIRQWFSDNAILDFTQPIPGRDFLLLERYRNDASIQQTLPITQASLPTQDIYFPDASLRLLPHPFAAELPAGETLYVPTSWEISQTATLAFSLRLYDTRGTFLLQRDEPLFSQVGNANQTLALPIPADTPPGVYFVALVVYAPDTLAPYLPQAADGSALPMPLLLDEIAIRLPLEVPRTPAVQARFDYIDLLKVELPPLPLTPGATLDSAWTWRPRPSSYRDHYQATVKYINYESETVLRLDFDLGSPGYPSSVWPANFPVRQQVRSELPATLPNGIYQVELSLTRTADGQTIPARQPWRPWHEPSINVGEVVIGN